MWRRFFRPSSMFFNFQTSLTVSVDSSTDLRERHLEWNRVYQQKHKRLTEKVNVDAIPIHSAFLQCSAAAQWLLHAVALSVCLWTRPHYSTMRARWRQRMVLCQNGSMAKVWTHNGGAQSLVSVKPHSCPPHRTLSNLCHSQTQTNKCSLCFSLTPLLRLHKDAASPQMLFVYPTTTLQSPFCS